MTSFPVRDLRISLFVTILALFLCAVLLVGAGVTVAGYIENRRNAFTVASDTFKEKIGRINERRLAFFASPFLIAQQLPEQPLLRDPTASKDQILKMILASLALNPQISAVYAGYENGNFFHVFSISDSEKSFLDTLGAPAATRFAVREIRVGGDGLRLQSWQFLDVEGRQIGLLDDEPATFDPRRRDWYREAREQPRRVVRSAPYLFATTLQVGLTLSKAFEGGAVGVDITLDRLMAYVRSVRSNENQRFVGFDEQRRLLAHFDPDRMFKIRIDNDQRVFELATTPDLKDPVVLKAVEVFESRGPYELERLSVAGSEYLATVDRQVGREGGVFYVLYAVPMSDFVGPLGHAAARSVLAALLVFVLALPAIIYFAHSISTPLRQLTREAELIQTFQLTEPVKLKSRVREVNKLIRSMSGMKGAIREVSKFVPKALVSELLESEASLEVGGAARRISILFSDIRDFTQFAGEMPAEDLVKKLSEYFEELASVIIREGGTVDKFIGDAVFAFWNAPQAIPRHEHVVCETALKCRVGLDKLNWRWSAWSRKPWQTRFGIHVGEAVVGNVGSSDRIDYTAIGDTVNIASRLEGLNKHYGTGILTSGEIADACSGEFLFRRIDRSRPKGASVPLDLFELLGMHEGPEELRATPELVRLVKDWDRVYEVYARRDWTGTLDALQAFAVDHPDDVVAGIYLSRVIGFVLEPPPADWDGAIHFGQK